jgi:hypothetical protein
VQDKLEEEITRRDKEAKRAAEEDEEDEDECGRQRARVYPAPPAATPRPSAGQPLPGLYEFR